MSGVFIFGSRLRQTNRCDSDLDVAVTIEACSESELLLQWTGNKSRWVRDLTSRVGLTIDLDIAHPGIAPKVWSYLQSGSAEIYKRTDCDKAAT